MGSDHCPIALKLQAGEVGVMANKVQETKDRVAETNEEKKAELQCEQEETKEAQLGV